MRPPNTNQSHSDEDEDGAPESLSLAQSKRRVKETDDKRKRHLTARKQKLKSLNREKDRRLKERSLSKQVKAQVSAEVIRDEDEREGIDERIVDLMEGVVEDGVEGNTSTREENEDDDDGDGDH